MSLVIIDPDGTLDFGLLLLVRASTGIRYQSQSGGVYCVNRSEEGYLVPVGSGEDAAPLQAFFRSRFNGNPPDDGSAWSPEALTALDKALNGIRAWRADGAAATPAPIQLDYQHLEGLTEAWIPVTSILGPAVLIFKNSD
jgi:hypothetical protein